MMLEELKEAEWAEPYGAEHYKQSPDEMLIANSAPQTQEDRVSADREMRSPDLRAFTSTIQASNQCPIMLIRQNCWRCLRSPNRRRRPVVKRKRSVHAPTYCVYGPSRGNSRFGQCSADTGGPVRLPILLGARGRNVHVLLGQCRTHRRKIPEDRYEMRSGSCFIVHGAGSRNDVEVLGVELDPAIAEETRGVGLPHWISIVEGDGADLVGTVGSFDPIFPDAPGGKIFKLCKTNSTLRPGGMLLVDDMDLTAHDDPELRDGQASVTDRLLADYVLVCADLSVASGVILACKRKA